MAYQPPSGFVSEAQAAELLGVTVFGLRDWRRRGYGPRSNKLGRRVLYRDRDIAAFLDGLGGEQPK